MGTHGLHGDTPGGLGTHPCHSLLTAAQEPFYHGGLHWPCVRQKLLRRGRQGARTNDPETVHHSRSIEFQGHHAHF
jgi:hypothetical protein